MKNTNISIYRDLIYDCVILIKFILKKYLNVNYTITFNSTTL